MDIPRTPSFRLDGKRALVAGGSSGIGFGCAAALAQAGAHVILGARNVDKLQDATSALSAAGFSAESVVMDVSNVDATGDQVATLGPFDVLVNSAGLARHSKAIETTTEAFDAVTNINLRGAYFLTRAVGKGLMKVNKPGSLINVSSQMGHVGGIDRAVYCSSKHAVEGFTKAMAIEFGPNRIRVNTIAPTFIRTPLTVQTFKNPERVKWIEEKIKLGRIGEIEDVMGATVFLASDASALVTGTSLLIDGGWTAD